jgi:hypothetical protein
MKSCDAQSEIAANLRLRGVPLDEQCLVRIGAGAFSTSGQAANDNIHHRPHYSAAKACG